MPKTPAILEDPWIYRPAQFEYVGKKLWLILLQMQAGSTFWCANYFATRVPRFEIQGCSVRSLAELH